MSTKIGLARIEDAAAIAEMSRSLIEHGLPWSWTEGRVRRFIREPESAAIVARDRRRIAGFAIMEFLDEHAHLSLLAVQPSYRHRGLGRELVQWLEASARMAGIFHIRLETRAENEAAQRFYAKLGYTSIARRRAYYAGVEDAICMHRDLSAVSTS